jgi:antitoxin VapB
LNSDWHRYCIYMDTAKLFVTGRSQAVRLPKAYRFEGTEVFIRKEGKAVIIEPKSKRRWPRDFFKKIRISDRAFRRPDQGSLPPVPNFLVSV